MKDSVATRLGVSIGAAIFTQPASFSERRDFRARPVGHVSAAGRNGPASASVSTQWAPRNCGNLARKPSPEGGVALTLSEAWPGDAAKMAIDRRPRTGTSALAASTGPLSGTLHAAALSCFPLLTA